MFRILQFSLLICLFTSFLLGQDDVQWKWQMQESNSEASLRGLCVVNENIAWASGTGGTVLRTEDGGKNWKSVSVPDAEEFDFRDVHAFDAERAVIVNAGQPAVFFRTEDGGETWEKVFQHDNENSFFDAVAAIDANHLIAMSDPVDDRVLLVESLDGGETWSELSADRRPLKEVGEAGFAASGSNMIVDRDSGVVYLALGSHEEGKESETSRVLVSRDAAKTWEAFVVPMKRNQSSGIFSLICLPESDFGDLGKHKGVCVMVGGNYLEPADQSGNVAIAPLGAAKESKIPSAKPRGYRSGVTYTLVNEQLILIAVGPDGTDVSLDNGISWQAHSEEGFHAVKSGGDGVVWASGANGRIAKLSVQE